MAQKVKEKAKRASGRTRSKAPRANAAPRATAAATPRAAAAPTRLEARIKALEEERDRLKSDLDAAHLRIAALEENRSTVANRIDWVIERLGGAVERGD